MLLYNNKMVQPAVTMEKINELTKHFFFNAYIYLTLNHINPKTLRKIQEQSLKIYLQ